MKLPSELVRGQSREDVALIQDLMTNSKTIRNELRKVLTRELDSAILQSESLVLSNSPELLGKLCDLQGYRRALRFAMSILTPDYEAESE